MAVGKGKRSEKAAKVTEAWLKEQGRAGKGRAQIAEELELTPSGLTSLFERRPELKEAFEHGRLLGFEDLQEVMRGIVLNPEEKANVKVQAYDKLARHSEPERVQLLQKSAISTMTDAELDAYIGRCERAELEKRLARASKEPTQVREAEAKSVTGSAESSEAEKVAVTDGD